MKNKVSRIAARNIFLDYCPSCQSNSSNVIIIDITGV